MSSLFSKLKEKLFGKKEGDETKEGKEEDKAELTEKEPQVQEKPTKDVDTEEALEKWREQVQYTENHPLTQAKIINSNLLRGLTEVLEQMNTKLNKLNKLDQILKILKESQQELKEKGVSSQKLNKAVEQMKNLTIEDKEVLRVVKNKGPLTASQLAEGIGVSRSTASSRLNKLYSIGVLSKEPEGRKIFFKTDLE